MCWGRCVLEPKPPEAAVIAVRGVVGWVVSASETGPPARKRCTRRFHSLRTAAISVGLTAAGMTLSGNDEWCHIGVRHGTP